MNSGPLKIWFVSQHSVKRPSSKLGRSQRLQLRQSPARTGNRPNPFNGCGYSYDPVLVGLDLLFWLALAGAAVSAIDLTWSRIFSRYVRRQTGSSAAQSS